MRRLPVYLVVETSNEMRGEGIDAAKHAISSLISDLKTDPNALEVAHISVITFAEQAEQICPLTELFEFEIPNLMATEGLPNLALALKKLSECIYSELVESTPTSKGDWHPIVFLISTGIPSPGWQEAAAELKSRHHCRFIACLTQSTANNLSVLRKIAGPEYMVEIHNIQSDMLKAFFKWTSVAIGVSSLEVANHSSMSLPSLPVSMQIVSTETSSSEHTNSENLLMLLEGRADLNARSKDGETPLHAAVRSANHSGVERLIANNAELEVCNTSGDTALLLAVKLGRDEIAALLIRAGANVNAQDKNGLTPLHYVMKRNGAAPDSANELTNSVDLPPPPRTIPFVP